MNSVDHAKGCLTIAFVQTMSKHKKYYLAHRERILAYTKTPEVKQKRHEYYLSRRDSPGFREKRQAYYRQHKTEINRRNREYYELNREKNLERYRLYQRRYMAKNREMVIERTRLWRIQNPDRQRAYRLKSIYDMSQSEFATLLETQSGKCAICGVSGKLCVDHDHETDRVRGLLCSQCNWGLGAFKDDPETLRLAADYLSRFNQ